MRSGLIALALVGAVGCTSQGQFQHQSTLNSATRGVVFDSDTTAQAGMVGNTCQVEVTSGMVGEDVDVAADEDVVQDGKIGGVLVLGSDGLHVHEPGVWNWGNYDPTVPGTDILAGRFVDTGVAAVRVTPSGLAVTWSGDASGQATLPGASSSAAIDADPATGTVLVADGEVSAAAPGEVADLGEGDLVAWDATLQQAYVATLGDSVVRAVALDGSERWSVQLDGAVMAITDLGIQGAALVSAEVAGGGLVIVLDGETGAVTLSESTPSAADSVSASPSGDNVAFHVGSRGIQATYFYNLGL